MIESVYNGRVKYWAKLKDKKYQNSEGLFLVEGEHLVEETSKCGKLKEVIILDGYDFDYDKKTYVSESVMKKITSLDHVPKIVGVAEKLSTRGIDGDVVCLDGIQDPGNLGTIIRSAVAFGIDTIVLGSGTVSVYNPKVVRATEGLMFHINIIEENIEAVLLELKSEGYKVFCTDVLDGVRLRDADFTTKNVIVMGSEGSGVSDKIKNLCDERLYIEMDESCESLNVGVATSIILYELKIKK